MTLTHVVFLIVAIAGLVAACALYATLIANEPPPTAAEQRLWPADVVEDNGEYDE